MEEAIIRAKSLLLVQQKEISRLQKKIDKHKEHHPRHKIKMKDGRLYVKLNDTECIISKDSVRCGDRVIRGQWFILNHNHLKMCDGDETRFGAFNLHCNNNSSTHLYFRTIDMTEEQAIRENVWHTRCEIIQNYIENTFGSFIKLINP